MRVVTGVNWRNWLLPVVIILLAGVVYCFWPGALGRARYGLWLALLALLALGVILDQRADVLPWPQSLAPISPPAGLTIFLPPLLLGLLALILLTAAQIPALLPLPTYLQAGLLVGGAGLVVWGLAGKNPPPAPRVIPRPPLWVLAALLLISIGAFLLRVYDLEGNVPRYVDELHSASAVARLWGGPETALLTQHGTITAFTWLYPLLQTVSVSLWGPTLTGLRVVSAIFGTFGVIAVWWLARELFDRETALIAALILATLPPHIHFSRLGLNNIADPLFGTLALAFLARGMKSGRQLHFTLAGAMLGFSAYWYEGGRLLFPPLALVFIGAWLLMLRQNKQPLPYKRVLVFVFAALVLTAPVYLAWWANDLSFTPRMNEMGADERDWLAALVMPMWAFVQMPDLGWFYGGQTGLVLAWLVPVLLIGLAALLWNLFQRGEAHWPGLVLLLVWGLATAFGNGLLREQTWTARYVVVFPALAIVLAWGVRYGAVLIFNLTPTNHVRGRVVIILAAALIAFGQVHYYYATHIPYYNYDFLDDIAFNRMLTQLPKLPSDSVVHIVAEHDVWRYDVDVMLRWHNRQDIDFEVILTDYLSFDYLNRLDRARDQYILTVAGDEAAHEFLGRCCDDAEIDLSVTPDATLYEQFVAYHLPPYEISYPTLAEVPQDFSPPALPGAWVVLIVLVAGAGVLAWRQI